MISPRSCCLKTPKSLLTARTRIDTLANTLPVHWRRWATKTWRTTPKANRAGWKRDCQWKKMFPRRLVSLWHRLSRCQHSCACDPRMDFSLEQSGFDGRIILYQLPSFLGPHAEDGDAL